MMQLVTPLTPTRPGDALRAALIGRVSTEGQDKQNIQASFRTLEKFVNANTSSPVTYIRLGEQASGMRADRESIHQVEEMIEAGEVDVVLATDLSRIHRNPRHQWAFLQDAVDAGVRVICPADALDTADE